jgi:hypothetical protein
MRTCIKCKTKQSTVWYRGPLCRKCYKQRWQRDNKNKVRNANRRWKNRHPEKERARHLTPRSRFNSAKKNSFERGKNWNISFEDFQKLIILPCYYCNNELGTLENYGSGLDRVDNDLGYSIDNVIPCCKICNSTRNKHFSVEETKIAIQAIINYRKSRVAL